MYRLDVQAFDLISDLLAPGLIIFYNPAYLWTTHN